MPTVHPLKTNPPTLSPPHLGQCQNILQFEGALPANAQVQHLSTTPTSRHALCVPVGHGGDQRAWAAGCVSDLLYVSSPVLCLNIHVILLPCVVSSLHLSVFCSLSSHRSLYSFLRFRLLASCLPSLLKFAFS